MPIQPTTARARARVEMTDDIKAAARRQLAEVGSDGLSLRAVAREVGLVSSAVYRYFASRDELLTALIVDCVRRGRARGRAGRRCLRRGGAWPSGGRPSPGPSAPGRWRNPHDYALIYGSPVPGYQAPTDTVSPALRVTVRGAGRAPRRASPPARSTPPPARPVARPVHADFSTIRLGIGMPTCPTRCWPEGSLRGPGCSATSATSCSATCTTASPTTTPSSSTSSPAATAELVGR